MDIIRETKGEPSATDTRPTGPYIRRLIAIAVAAVVLCMLLSGCFPVKTTAGTRTAVLIAYVPGKLTLVDGKDTVYVAEDFTRRSICIGDRFRISYDSSRRRVIDGIMHYESTIKKVK